MNANELEKTLKKHLHRINEECEDWENVKVNLRGANLWRATLCEADLREADLREADLRGANLQRADLREADLRGANLQRADLQGANLWRADLREADLCEANLQGANLQGADLQGAKLWRANLQGANLRGAKNIPKNIASSLMACPEEGSFIGWKKCEKFIFKLKIPEDAKRSSATTRKCRCSKAEVLDIQTFDGGSADILFYDHKAYKQITRYEIGKEVFPDSFDEDRWNECSHGIHFFITREEAVNY